MNETQFELYTNENQFNGPMGISSIRFAFEDILGIEIELKNISKTTNKENETTIDCIVDTKFIFNKQNTGLSYKGESTDPNYEGNPIAFNAFIKAEATASILIESDDKIKVYADVYSCVTTADMINFSITNVDKCGSTQVNHQENLCHTLLAHDHDFFNSHHVLSALKDLLIFKIANNSSEYI